MSVFEVLAIGLGSNVVRNIDATIDTERLEAALEKVWEAREFKEYAKSGVTASRRLPRLVPLGRRLFDVI